MIPGVKRVCLGCGVLTSFGSRCEGCFAILDAKRTSAREETRPSSSQRGYGSQWQRTRLAVLNRDKWTCYQCGKHLVGPDATVDHIVAKANGGTDDMHNLAAMCRSHNSAKQAR